MSTSTLHPPKILKITTTANPPVEIAWWPAGSAHSGKAYKWRITFFVESQSHSDPNSSTPYYYTGMDVLAGDWISNALGGMTWKINLINSKSNSSVTCEVEDVNQFNTYNDSTTNGNGSPPMLISGFLFSLDVNNNPILVPVQSNVLQYTWQTDVLGRFLFSPP